MISFFYQSAYRVCHVTMLNGPRFIDIKSKHLRIFLGNLRKSSENFENVRKHSYDYQTTFSKSSEIFRKWSEIFGKSSKTSLLVGLSNKQNNTWLLGDMKFIFSCSNRYLTHSLRSLVRYRVEHEKINFISPRNHVLSSISYQTNLHI